MEHKNETKVAMRVSTVSIGINFLLALGKLIAGLVASSQAMVSDAIHSASDVFSTFIVIIGVNISAKKSDEEHPYGHERMECVASIILSMMLAITGFGIGISGLEKVMAGNYDQLKVPGGLALLAAVVSIVVKEWMFWYTRSAAKKINSGALMADAWHHRSDALSSVGALIGITGARMGYPVLDPIASIVICIFIEKAAYDIFKDAIDKMVDKSCPEDVEEKMKQMVLEEKEVKRVDLLKTRLFGNKIYVDIEIAVEGTDSLTVAHEVAEKVHDKIEQNFSNVKHCMVHVNPYEEETSGKEKSDGERATNQMSP